MSNGTLHFETTMDNSQFLRKIRENRQAILDSGKTAKAQASEKYNRDYSIKDNITSRYNSTTITPTSYLEDYTLAEKKWNESKKILEGIEKDKKNFSTKAFHEAVQNEEKFRNSFKKLGGIIETSLNGEYKKAIENEKKFNDAFTTLCGSVSSKTTAEGDYSKAINARNKQNEDEATDILRQGITDRMDLLNLEYLNKLSIIDKERESAKAKAVVDKVEFDDSSFVTAEKNAFSSYVNGLDKLGDEEHANHLIRVKEKVDAMNQYLAKYGDYQEKKYAITEIYAKKIADAKTEGDKLSLGKEKEINIINELETKEIIKGSSLIIDLFTNSANQSKKQIKNIIASTEQLLKYLEGDKDTELPFGITKEQADAVSINADQIKDKLNSLIEKQEELDSRINYPFSGFIKGFERLRRSSKLAEKALKETDLQKKKMLEDEAQDAKAKGLNFIASGAVEATNALTSTAEAYKNLAETSGNDKLKESSEQLSAVAQNFSAAAQGFASSGWIGAIIGGVTDMVTQTVQSFAIVKAEETELERNSLNFLSAYHDSLLRIKDEDYESVFGSKGLQKAIDATGKAKEAMTKYEESLSQQTIPSIEKEFKSLGSAIFGFGVAGGASFAGLGKSATNESKAALEAYKKGYTDLEAMTVKTKDRSGWSNFWGKKDEYTSLKDLAPQLWDTEGQFNTDAAILFLETNTQITDEQRKQIQAVIDQKDAYNDATAVVDDYLKTIFGHLSGEITDAIWDSVMNGTDAWESFEDSGSKAIANLGKQMINELIVQSYLDTFMPKMKDAFNKEDPTKELSIIMADIYNGLGGVLEAGTEAAQGYKEWAEGEGIDLSDGNNEDNRTASAKGIATASQDSVDENNERLTSIQGLIFNMDENQKKILEYNIASLSQLQKLDNLDYLSVISENTSYCKYLETIDNTMGKMNTTLSRIEATGLKMQK